MELTSFNLNPHVEIEETPTHRFAVGMQSGRPATNGRSIVTRLVLSEAGVLCVYRDGEPWCVYVNGCVGMIKREEQKARKPLPTKPEVAA